MGCVRSMAFWLVLSAVTGLACAARGPDQPSQAAGPGTPKASPLQAVPSDWQRVTIHDLVIPLPPGWQKTIDTVGKSDRPEPDPPQILYFEDKAAEPAAARFLSIWIWPSPSVDELVRKRFVEENSSFISQATVPSSRPMREVVGVASWSGPTGAGTYRGRHLFIQVDPERVVSVVVMGPRVPSTESEPTSEMRRIQEIVASHVEALPAAGCPRTRSTDASGVLTLDGQVGILDRTYASSTAVNEAFVMVRRGAAVGDRVSVEFRQIGTSAPASWVAYGVGAEPYRSPWGDAAFRLGVKPIGFANSCWRLMVNASDTGIVLRIGP